MEEYVVICYAVHDKAIASYDVFDNIDDAQAFLKQDVQNTYEEEKSYYKENCGTDADEEGIIEFDVSDNGNGYFATQYGEVEWTWEIIRIS